MSCLAYVQDRKGRVAPFNQERITEPLINAFGRVKVLPPDKDPKQIAEEITKRVVAKLECLDKQTITKDEIVEAHRLVFRELMSLNNGFPMTQRQTLAYMEEFLAYAAGVALVENGIIAADRFTPDGVPREKVAQTWQWNVTHECHTIEKLNEWVLGLNGKKLGDLIKMSEERYSQELETAAQIVLERPESMFATFIGPSSSGKTTTANRTRDLIEQLAKQGKKIRWLEVDNYFKNKKSNDKYEYAVRGKNGEKTVSDWDYETPLAYDIATLQQDLADITARKTVWIPHYDFEHGIVYPKHTEFLPLKENEIIGIDCLHGGSQEINGMLPAEKTVKIFIEAENTVHDGQAYTRWTDVRLIRRMLRDVATRGHDTLLTLLHWHLVRKGELMHMIPLINTADTIINGGMPYELPVYKRHAERFFREYLKVLEANPHLGDAYVRCQRVCDLFDKVEMASEKQIELIPKNAVTREFIGGSIYYPKFPYGLLDTKMPEEV